MADPQTAAETAPKAWKGWRSIQGAVNVSLRTSLYNAGKINSTVMRGKRR